VVRQHLADQEDLVTAAGDGLPDQDFRVPSAYISAVSIRVMPTSRPRRSAAISSGRRARLSARCQVPCPSTGMSSPEGSVMAGMGLAMSPPRVAEVRQKAR